MMPLYPNCLLGARHVHPGVRTEADYRRKQREVLDLGRAAYPNLTWPHPWLAKELPEVFVAGGEWQIRCATPRCRNYPRVQPEWRLALCFDCGAIYEELMIPANAGVIENLLVKRPDMATRNWLPGETPEQLARENAEHHEVMS